MIDRDSLLNALAHEPRSLGRVKNWTRSKIAAIGASTTDEDHGIIDQEADS
jgi:hypothetical protein